MSKGSHTYMYPDAVIFDFDGVIVDTEPIHYKSFQIVLEPLGLGYTWKDYTEKYMGFDDRDAFREAFRIANKPLENTILNELIQNKARIFKHVAQSARPYSGVIELILELSSMKIPLAISSGALKTDILPILSQLEIHDHFTHIISADDVTKSKPDPASYITAMQRLISTFPEKLDNNSSIYAIEDTPAGILSAKGAGLKVIAVTNSYSKENLTIANMIIEDLSQLLRNQWP